MFHTNLCEVKIVQTKKDLRELKSKWEKSKYCFFDTETSGLRVRVPENDYVVGYTIAFEDSVDKRVFYVPLRHEFEGEYDEGHITLELMDKLKLNPKDFPHFDVNDQSVFVYTDKSNKEVAYWENVDQELFMYMFKDLLEDFTKIWIAHNLSFDMHVLANMGIDIDKMLNTKRKNWDDTMVMNHTFDEESEKKLEKITERVYSLKKVDYDDVVATVTVEEKKQMGLKGNVKATFNLVQIPVGAQYSGEDVWFMKQMYPDFIAKLKEDEQYDLYRKMRVPFLKSLWKMERRGMRIDEPRRAQMEIIAEKELKKMQYRMIEIAGVMFNTASGQQVGELLYGHKKKLKDKKTGEYRESYNKDIVAKSFGFPITHWTDGGKSKDKQLKNPQTNDDALQEILTKSYTNGRKQEGIELVEILVEFNRLQKLHSAFIVGIKEKMYQDGFVHPSLNQCGTDSWRLSCNDPNLQQLPKPLEEPRYPKRDPDNKSLKEFKKEVSKYKKDKKKYDFWIRFEIRSLFIPDEEEYSIVAGDWSNLEKRISAHLTGDEALIRMFNEGLDGHGLIATMIFPEIKHVHPNDVKYMYRDLRDIAKTVGFAIDYGGSEYTVSQNLGISKELARTYIDNYFAGFSGLAEWGDNQKRFGRRYGYVLTLLAHKRHLSGIRDDNMKIRMYYERVALNSSIQGTAADVACLAQNLIENDPILRLLGFTLRMQIHDELVGVCPTKYVNLCMERLKMFMETCLPEELIVPLISNVDCGQTYAEAK